MINLKSAPFPVTYRELWLPELINNNASLQGAGRDKHGLTLTGARKGTTCEGVHFTGAATSNINCGALHDASAKLWISLRFKLDQDIDSGLAANQYLFGKYIDADNYLAAWFASGDGRIWFVNRVAASSHLVASTEASWTAGEWYHVLASISSVNAMRLIIDGGTAQTDSDTSAAPNGGDLCFGDQDDPGGGTGLQGIIEDIVVGTDDLSAAEEANLCKGIPPADAVNFYPCDEGRGSTVYDRGSGGNNGTLDSSVTWIFGQVVQPLISADGINDYLSSSASIDLSGELTFILVQKVKSTYHQCGSDKYFFMALYDGTNHYRAGFDSATNQLIFFGIGNNSSDQITSADWTPSLDDYQIFILTSNPGSFLGLYSNGEIVNITGTGIGAIPRGGATVYLCRTNYGAAWDVTDPLLCAIINGSFTSKQAKQYSRWLRDIFNLPITI